jgi:hypothetical protein
MAREEVKSRKLFKKGGALECGRVHFIALSKTKETNVLFVGFRKMRYAKSDESWALS